MGSTIAALGIDIDDLIEKHVEVMPFMWTVVINAAILSAMFKFSKISMALHGIIALAASITTLVLAYPLYL